MKNNNIYSIAKDASFRTIGNDVFILLSKSGKMARISDSGVMLWKWLIKNNKDFACFNPDELISPMTSLITQKYEIDHNTAEDDVKNFMNILIENGILTPVKSRNADSETHALSDKS